MKEDAVGLKRVTGLAERLSVARPNPLSRTCWRTDWLGEVRLVPGEDGVANCVLVTLHVHGGLEPLEVSTVFLGQLDVDVLETERVVDELGFVVRSWVSSRVTLMSLIRY